MPSRPSHSLTEIVLALAERVSVAGRPVLTLALKMIVQLERASSHPNDVQALPLL